MAGKNKAWLLLTLCNLFWAGNYILGKYVVAEMTPLWITFSRWLAASLLLLGIAHFYEKPDWRGVGAAWPTLTGMGLLGIVGYNTVLYSALNYTSATNAALVSALNPGVMVVFSAFLLREKISRIQVLGIAVSFTGVLVVLTGGVLHQLLQLDFNRGDLLMLVAILMWTLYSIIGKRLTAVPPVTATAASALIATLIMAPFAAAQGIDAGSISPFTMVGILYIILFPSICSFIFWNISVREVGAGKAGIFLNLIPVFTAAISWMMGERITAAQVIGGLLVFLGVYLTSGLLDRRMARKA